ncbi:MAG: MFS transporter [Hyphomonas sp.]|uniref:MFS transporter n=1 Tax=Hyphomonas sp. TaxID=87 RepID=UPI0017D6F9DD|nr:MFS transporter [Hyphomonas sp.]MBA3067847.1 MFS transporter [Hyphomonas sp.]MBU4062403.1 MFS transporter [Alphaproteobacteria bacterium]MBU4165988.1 MFS transporter [Alphaproteobacteria bacterium]
MPLAILDPMDPRDLSFRPVFAFQFAIANFGAFLGCLPILAILVPMKAQEIDPGGSSDLLSWTIMLGALVASSVNLAAGWLSDLTSSRIGRRKPWIVAGSVLTIASYALVLSASTRVQLVGAVIALQAAFNIMLPSLIALLPDEVPDARKGFVAALLAVGAPLGLGVGAFLMGISTLSLSQRLALPGGLMVVCILPLLLFWKERAGSDLRRQEVSKVVIEAKVSEAVLAEDRWRDFWRIWWSRFFVQIAFSVCQSYLLLFLIRARQLADVGSGLPAETVAGRLLLVSTSLSLLVAVLIGAATDRIGRRKLFVVAAGFFVAAGMGLMAAQPTLTGFILGQLLYGVGVGLYSSAEVALAAELLPTRLHAARDLAVLNIGNAVPQAVAPALALAIIGNYGAGYSVLFGAGCLSAIVGGLIAARIRTAK